MTDPYIHTLGIRYTAWLLVALVLCSSEWYMARCLIPVSSYLLVSHVSVVISLKDYMHMPGLESWKIMRGATVDLYQQAKKSAEKMWRNLETSSDKVNVCSSWRELEYPRRAVFLIIDRRGWGYMHAAPIDQSSTRTLWSKPNSDRDTGHGTL